MLSIRFEQLHIEEIIAYLKRSQYIFPSLKNDKYLLDYALKLSKNANFIVGRDNYGEIGCLIAFYANKRPLIFLTHVHTFTKYSKQGYLRKMLNIIKSNQKIGFNRIDLEVNKNNFSAIRAYENLGFSIINENETKYQMSLNL